MLNYPIRDTADTPKKLPIVGALLVRGGKVLLGRRSMQRPTYPGCWDLIGGHLEGNEDADTAIRREVEEELGVKPTAVTLIGRIDLFEPLEGMIDYFIFVVTGWEGGEPRLADDEHTELRWFAPTEAQALDDMSLQGAPWLFDVAAAHAA